LCIWQVQALMEGKVRNTSQMVTKEMTSKRKKYKEQYHEKENIFHSSKKHNKDKIKCFNCGKKSNYARECNESDKVHIT
jgi:hypothetical protein